MALIRLLQAIVEGFTKVSNDRPIGLRNFSHDDLLNQLSIPSRDSINAQSILPVAINGGFNRKSLRKAAPAFAPIPSSSPVLRPLAKRAVSQTFSNHW